MTEDDVINRLKRVPFNEIYSKWRDNYDPEKNEELFKYLGWTWSEFWPMALNYELHRRS